MKQNEIEMVLEPSSTKPKVSDGTVVARPTGVAQSGRNAREMGGFRKRKQTIDKLFCAPRELAVALLEDLIRLAGAHDIVISGNITEDSTPEDILRMYSNAQDVSANAQKFVIDLSDRLMIDCGLDEKDINNIMNKLGVKPEHECNHSDCDCKH